jgi:hypothetical protein
MVPYWMESSNSAAGTPASSFILLPGHSSEKARRLQYYTLLQSTAIHFLGFSRSDHQKTCFEAIKIPSYGNASVIWFASRKLQLQQKRFTAFSRSQQHHHHLSQPFETKHSCNNSSPSYSFNFHHRHSFRFFKYRTQFNFLGLDTKETADAKRRFDRAC